MKQILSLFRKRRPSVAAVQAAYEQRYAQRGAVRGRSALRPATDSTWVKRNTSVGKFYDVKAGLTP